MTDWKKKLPPDVYRIMFEGGTEAPFTGQYVHEHAKGRYHCAACGAALFKSDAKYDSGSGWPSFYEALDPEAIARREDHSHGMHRIEVLCAKCGGHLGHLFNDGPHPTGMRYCVNSKSLELHPDTKKEEED